MFSNLKTVIFISIAEVLIYLGVTFLSGQLLPSYTRLHSLPYSLKLIFFLICISLPANLLISWGFQSSGGAFAGIVYSTAAIIGAMACAILIDGAKINLSFCIAFGLMLVGAVWGMLSLNPQ